MTWTRKASRNGLCNEIGVKNILESHNGEEKEADVYGADMMYIDVVKADKVAPYKGI